MDPHNSTGTPGTGTSSHAMCQEKRNADGEELTGLQTFQHKPDDKTRPANIGVTKESSALQSPVSIANPEAEMEKFIRDMIEDFGPDRFAFFVYLGLVCIGMISIAGLFLLPWSSITTIITGFVTFVIVSSIF